MAERNTPGGRWEKGTLGAVFAEEAGIGGPHAPNVPQVPSGPPLGTAVRNLHSEVETLYQTMCVLVQRLDSVLAPSEPQANKLDKSVPVPGGSAATRTICDVTTRIAGMRGAIEQILDRLEV